MNTQGELCLEPVCETLKAAQSKHYTEVWLFGVRGLVVIHNKVVFGQRSLESCLTSEKYNWVSRGVIHEVFTQIIFY